jgi:DNA-binding phage protein
MNEIHTKKLFIHYLQKVVDKYGSRAEAARKCGFSKAFVSDTLNGKGPDDPKTETWNKVFFALGMSLMRDKRVSSVHEDCATFTVHDRFMALSDWLRTQPEDVQSVFFSMAKIHGFEKG